MAGFQSRIRDIINQASPTFATAAVSLRGLSQFIDPSLTGSTRFFQKAGYPFPLLTPQMSALLEETASAGSRTALIQGQRLLSWLIPGLVVSFELLEDNIIESVEELGDGLVRIVLQNDLEAAHAAGTRFSIRGFFVSASSSVAGDGSVGRPAVEITTPFILVPGDKLVIDGETFTLSEAEQTGIVSSGFTYEVKTEKETGFPELSLSTDVLVLARPAYRSDLVTMPQGTVRSLVRGPAVIDWVSGPLVADYFPDPESEVYVEEFNSANRQTVAPRRIEKNDAALRFRIVRDQLLFWKAAEGGTDWDGTYAILRAYDSGRAHLWTPCRPLLDPAPPVTTYATVPGFAPYAVLLLSRIVSGSVVVKDANTKAVIPDTDYIVDESAGTVSFIAARASTPVVITYRPKLEWQVIANADDDIELCVTVGNEPKQIYNLSAGVPQTLTIRVETEEQISQIHITARRADDSAGPFSVKFSDFTPRSGVTSAIRYTISTSAEIDYDWASSGLLIKPIWANLELLRGRLDGESTFSRYLDNGRMLV